MVLAQYQQQITPDPVQGDYANRPDTELEATIFGRISNFDLLFYKFLYKNSINKSN